MANILYGAFVSPYVRKTILALRFKGIEFESKFVRPHSDEADFKAASPLGKIPAWKDEQVTTSDSTVIIHHIENNYDGPKLLPQNPQQRADAIWYEEYADTTMMPIFGPKLFAEVMLAKVLFQREPIQEDIDLAVNVEIPKMFTFLESQLQSDFLAGESLSVADIAIGALLLGYRHCHQTIDAGAYPKLSAYCDRVFASEPFLSWIPEEVAMLKQSLGYDSPL